MLRASIHGAIDARTNCTAAVVRAPNGNFSIEQVTVGASCAGEVPVKIAVVGLCHTERIYRDQFIPYQLPAILGHAGTGVEGGQDGLLEYTATQTIVRKKQVAAPLA